MTKLVAKCMHFGRKTKQLSTYSRRRAPARQPQWDALSRAIDGIPPGDYGIPLGDLEVTMPYVVDSRA